MRKVVVGFTYPHQLFAGSIYLNVKKTATDSEIEDLAMIEWVKVKPIKVTIRDNDEDDDWGCY